MIIKTLQNLFPILESLKGYNKKSFFSDLSAGFVVGVMLIPQGMAYAFLAGMPPVYGLYAGLIPLFIYALLGTSRHLSVGPVAISALLVLAGVSKLAEPFSAEYIELTLLAGFLIGMAQFLLGLFRVGFLVNFISHPVIAGFTSAAAVIISINQLKDVFGIQVPRFEYLYETVIHILGHVSDMNIISFLISLFSLLIMFLLKRWNRKLPYALFVVVIGILVSWIFDLSSEGVAIIGDIPKGLPAFTGLDFSLENVQLLLPTVFTVTLIGVVECIGIAKVMEGKNQNYIVKPDQELKALGIAKIVGSYFQALPSSGSFSRSAINNELGSKTTIASIISAAIIFLTLLFLTPLFYYLPNAVLASIILLAVFGLFDIKEAKELWKHHHTDFAMMLITFLITLILGIEIGVLTGVICSVGMMLYRSSRPDVIVLGKVPGTNYYRNVIRFKEAIQPESKLIIRFDDQLYFANADFFKESVRQLVRDYDGDLNQFILDAKSIHSIDSTGLRALEDIVTFLSKRDIQFTICGAIGVVRDLLESSGFLADLGDDHHFIFLDDALD